MEKTVFEPVSRPQSPVSQAVGNLLSSQADLVTEDLASFLVAHHILISGLDSIAAIKEYFRRMPEVLPVVDHILAKLHEAELIQVSGDKIKATQRFVDIGGNVENLRRFLPRVFKISAERILADAELGSHKAKREALRYFALPDDNETSAEAQALYLEFKAKMLNLVNKADREGRTAERIRLVGIFNCALVPEDFV